MRRVAVLMVAAFALAAAPAGGAKKPLKVKRGQATIEFDFAFGVKLVQAGATPHPIAPAMMEATTFTFPVRSGTVNRKGTRATIRHRGGQSLESEYVTRTIENLTARIRGNRIVVYADAGGNVPGVAGIAFLRGRGTAKRTKNGLTFTVPKLRLTGLAAADTNAQFSTNAFRGGEVAGSATFVARR